MSMKPTKAEVEEIHRLYAAVEDAISAYSEAVVALGERLREAFNERSERWQQREAGQEAEERIQAIENADIEAHAGNIPGLDELGL